uniref:Elongation of fatty acids protein n=1 Tax=Arcella intermedia TaxID=1963864 RepID=A0A6B2LCX7_9EUKA
MVKRLGVDLKVDEFEWNSSKFLYSSYLMLSLCICYLLLIFGVQRLMLKREPFSLKWIVAIHNGILSLSSLVLLVLFVEELYKRIAGTSLVYSICDIKVLQGSVEYFCYLNHILKYYEFLDTLFLALKKKDIPFLHIYHHTLTLILTHVQLEGKTVIQWVPIVLNLFVHVLMYYYYMIATFGYSVWWKKHLTSLQIIQFVLDLIFCYIAAYLGYISDFKDCQGTAFCAVFGIGLLSTYLLLFLDFFVNTYTKKPHVAEKPKPEGKAPASAPSKAKQPIKKKQN